MNPEFEQFVLNGPIASQFEPVAYFNTQGDCFEFIAANETFRAERLDSLVTIYVGRRTSEVVGCQIKGISKYIEEVLDEFLATSGLDWVHEADRPNSRADRPR